MGLGQITIAVYALLIFAGGMDGYISKHSVASLVSSSILAILLAVSLVISRKNPKLGLGLGAFFTLATLGRFIPTYLQKGVFFPNGLFAIIGIIAVILIGLEWSKQNK